MSYMHKSNKHINNKNNKNKPPQAITAVTEIEASTPMY
jgi:hypothetical protein